MILKLVHARELGYCNKGLRNFCLRYNLDWDRFVTDGLPFSELSHIDDSMLHDLLRHSEGRNG